MAISIGVIVLGTALCALSLVLLRNYRREKRLRYHKSPIAGDILGVIGTGYTVILAFVIFIAFGSYENANNDAGHESVAVRQLDSLTLFFPEPSKTELQGDLICYTRAVIYDEWPQMANGSSSTQVDAWVNHLDQDLVAMPVDNDKAVEAFNTWFSRSAERQDGRRGRVSEASSYVPAFVWAMIVLLFFVVVGYQVLFADATAPLLPQLIGISAVSATLLAGIMLVYVLDAPFANRGVAIAPVRMQATLSVLESGFPPGAAAAPCDSAGNPAS